MTSDQEKLNNPVSTAPKNPLEEWFNTLEKYEQAYWINRLSRACDVTTVTLYAWKNGTRTIRRPFAEIINKEIGEEIIPL